MIPGRPVENRLAAGAVSDNSEDVTNCSAFVGDFSGFSSFP